jgi:3'-5' exonuclease
MALFEDVFNKSIIYEMLFFNAKAVLIYPTLKDLEENNKPLFERWMYLSESKYKVDLTNLDVLENTYVDNAAYYPEYTRIVAITYATLYAENGTLKRYFKKIVNEDEYIVLATFMDVLHELSSEGVKSNPQFFPILCGHNIISYDIPLLIKRFLINKDKFEASKQQLPYMLKRSLGIKPWESGVVDTVNVWKFNGYDNMPLMLIADYLKLKKTADLLPLGELNRYYWKNVVEKPAETLEHVSLQSATQTNLVIQLMNELRQL